MEMLDHEKDATMAPIETPAMPTENVVEIVEQLPEPVETAPIDVEQKHVTIEELVVRIKEIANMPEDEINIDEAGRVKQQFYYLRTKLMADTNEIAEAAETESDIESEFKAALAIIKEKKAAVRAKIEAELLSNLDSKKGIITEIKEISADTDNVNKHYQRVKELQTEFKAIGEVPQQNATEIWKAYQEAIELFYDQWKVNKELRDYDFKKNLAEKQLLIDEAMKLHDETDVVIAFRRLQELHEKWREIGPVAKEYRDEIWDKFKDASATVNKRYQEFFEERKRREQKNEDAKTALCEKIESIDIESLRSYSAWNKATQEIMEAQEQWKTFGFASRKTNNALFARFRQTCDKFFAAKAEFFGSVKDEQAQNLAAKTELCIKAEALKDSTDWKKTTDSIVELQKRWKTIGAVPKKQSDAIWRRFMDACDYFFHQKKAATSATRKTEQANLTIKREILATLTELNSPSATTPRDAAIKEIHALRSRWQATGHVPFKEKEHLAEAYRETVRQLFDKYDIHENRARQASFEAAINEMADNRQKLLHERERLIRAYESRIADLKTYENNLGFFSAKTKNGNSMLVDLQNKIQRIKSDIAEIENKVRLIDNKL